MSAYNPITTNDLERIAALGGWDVTLLSGDDTPFPDGVPLGGDSLAILKRADEYGEDIEVRVYCAGRGESGVEVAWWFSTGGEGYDSRDDEPDDDAPETWRPTVALGSLVSHLLFRPVHRTVRNR